MSNSIDLRQIVWMDIIEEAHKTQSQWFYLLSSSVGISRKNWGSMSKFLKFCTGI